MEVLNKHVAGVPEDERHRTPRKDCSCFRCVPSFSIAIDAAGTVAVDSDIGSRYDEASLMVLKSNWIGVTAPVIEVLSSRITTKVHVYRVVLVGEM